MANFQLGDTQKVSFALNALDADGNITTLTDGDTATVVSSDTASALIVIDATPVAGSLISGFIVGGTKVGTVTITGSAHKVDGTIDFSVDDHIDIVAGAITNLGFSLGTPVAQ